MNIEQQVSNLKLSKRLKELGVKQESLFWWNMSEIPKDYKTKNKTTVNPNAGKKGYHNTKFEWKVSSNIVQNGFSVSAYTSSELGEMLKEWAISEYINTAKEKYCCFSNGSWGDERFYAKTEANARAKMLIYLLENNSLTLNL